MPRVELTYAPYADVGAEPNVVVDGTPTSGTTLTLSHWPGAPAAPAALQADLSAQYDGVHPMALHRATTAPVLLLVADGVYKLTHRYETWVQYRSRSLPRRADLAPLAEELTAADDVAWHADPIDELTPELRPEGPSSLAPDVVLAIVRRHLATAPPAFDPYATDDG